MIINERKYVDTILETGKFDNVGKDAFMLVKHFYNIDKDAENTKDCVLQFMYENVDDFNKEEWENSIANMVNTVSKGGLTLRDIDGVFVDRSEMEIISTIENKHERKCLFTLIVLSKIKNQTTPNDVWVDVTLNELFTYGNMKCLSKDRKLEVLNALKSYGYINTYLVFNKTNNTRKMVYKSLISKGVDYGWFIDEDTNIGKVYDDYVKKNELGWKNCSVCGELFKSKNNYNAYCKVCSKEKELENKRKWWENNKTRSSEKTLQAMSIKG